MNGPFFALITPIQAPPGGGGGGGQPPYPSHPWVPPQGPEGPPVAGWPGVPGAWPGLPGAGGGGGGGGGGSPPYPSHPWVPPQGPEGPPVAGWPGVPGHWPSLPGQGGGGGGGGQQPPYPSHPIYGNFPQFPIYYPPGTRPPGQGGPPLGIWGPNDPRPTVPIVLPIPPDGAGGPPPVEIPEGSMILVPVPYLDNSLPGAPPGAMPAILFKKGEDPQLVWYSPRQPGQVQPPTTPEAPA
jgi:hypothetical protein